MDNDELAAMEHDLQVAIAEVPGLRDDPAGLAVAEDRATEIAGLIREESERRRQTRLSKSGEPRSSVPARADRTFSKRTMRP